MRLIRCGSRALTPAEKNYSVTELELLAVAYAMRHSSFYLASCPHFRLKTDHRPLVGLFNKGLADIDNARLRRLRMKTVDYNFDTDYVQGKKHLMADALSRPPMLDGAADDAVLETSDVNSDNDRMKKDDVAHAFYAAAALDPRLLDLYDQVDDESHQLYAAIKEGSLPSDGSLDAFSKVFDDLSIHASGGYNLIMLNNRLYVPGPARPRLLRRLHASHLGTSRMQQLASRSFYWPGMANDVANHCKACPECREIAPAQKKMPSNREEANNLHELFPMAHFCLDLFQAKGKHFLAGVDRFSGFPFMAKLGSLTTQTVINKLLGWFASEGLPTVLISDNGPQFSSQEFSAFCSKYGINHITSAPYMASHNGMAEAAVARLKRLVETTSNDEELNIALLALRTAPGSDKTTPALLFRHRFLRDTVPVVDCDSLHFATSDVVERAIAKRVASFDSMYDRLDKGRGKEAALEPGDVVDIKRPNAQGWDLAAGIIKEKVDGGRSYIIDVDGSTVRKSVEQLKVSPVIAYSAKGILQKGVEGASNSDFKMEIGQKKQVSFLLGGERKASKEKAKASIQECLAILCPAAAPKASRPPPTCSRFPAVAAAASPAAPPSLSPSPSRATYAAVVAAGSTPRRRPVESSGSTATTSGSTRSGWTPPERLACSSSRARTPRPWTWARAPSSPLKTAVPAATSSAPPASANAATSLTPAPSQAPAAASALTPTRTTLTTTSSSSTSTKSLRRPSTMAQTSTSAAPQTGSSAAWPAPWAWPTEPPKPTPAAAWVGWLASPPAQTPWTPSVASWAVQRDPPPHQHQQVPCGWLHLVPPPWRWPTRGPTAPPSPFPWPLAVPPASSGAE